MDPALFQKIKRAFERQNGGTKTIDQSVEAQFELWQAGGRGQTGMTLSAGDVLMVPNPPASTVFDEMIHTSQFRRGLVQEAFDTYGVDRGMTFLEIQVQEKMLRNARPYRLTPEEVSSIEARLQALREQFDLGK